MSFYPDYWDEYHRDAPEEKVVECAPCAAKPGSPPLCHSCLANRSTIERLNAGLKRYRDHPVRFRVEDRVMAFRRALEAAAWPSYECEQCVGQEPSQGCYCAYHEGIAPGVGPEEKHLLLRRIHRFFWPHSHFHTR